MIFKIRHCPRKSTHTVHLPLNIVPYESHLWLIFALTKMKREVSTCDNVQTSSFLAVSPLF